MSEGSAARIDPRFEPRFQRGYVPDESVSRAEPPSAPAPSAAAASRTRTPIDAAAEAEPCGRGRRRARARWLVGAGADEGRASAADPWFLGAWTVSVVALGLRGHPRHGGRDDRELHGSREPGRSLAAGGRMDRSPLDGAGRGPRHRRDARLERTAPRTANGRRRGGAGVTRLLARNPAVIVLAVLAVGGVLVADWGIGVSVDGPGVLVDRGADRGPALGAADRADREPGAGAGGARRDHGGDRHPPRSGRRRGDRCSSRRRTPPPPPRRTRRCRARTPRTTLRSRCRRRRSEGHSAARM